jgi:hypothetical protein
MYSLLGRSWDWYEMTTPMNPLNLLIRFLLEIAALAAIGLWGWSQTEEWIRILLAIGIPLLVAAIWGIFAVPNDPSRSGKTVITTPGSIRLCIELLVFFFAALVIHSVGYSTISLIFVTLVVIHYLASYKRILWLVKQ